ncbi:hypothetical protein RLIN73S_00817 [Rhodanobacter lindaniclasticus]
MAFIRLKPWGERGWGPDQKAAQEQHEKLVKEGKAKPINPGITAEEFIAHANGAVQSVRDAQIFIVNVPTVQGLGQFGGFDMYLQDRGGAGRELLTAARNTLLGKANQDPVLTAVRPNGLEDVPQLAAGRRPHPGAGDGPVGGRHLQRDQPHAGAGVRQRLLLRAAASSASDHAGRLGLSHGPGCAAAHVHAEHAEQRQRHPADDPAVQRGAGEVADGVAVIDPLQRLLGGRDRRLAGTGARLGRGDERDAEDRRERPAARLRLRLDRPVVPGDPLRQLGHPADAAVPGDRVPVPHRAVRELVDPGVGAAGGAAGHPRRGGVHPAARPAERHLLQDRRHHRHGPGLRRTRS